MRQAVMRSAAVLAGFAPPAMWGTFEATYSTGDKISGKVSGTRGM